AIFYNDKEINKSQYEKLLISIINKSSLQIIIHYKFEFGDVRDPMKLSFLNFLIDSDFIRVITHMIRVIKKKAENLNEKDGKKEKYLIDNITPILSNIFYEDCPFDYTHTQDEKELIYAILEIDPPIDFFLKNYYYLYIITEIKPSFIFKYLQKVKRKCILLGENHNKNLINYLSPIIERICENKDFLSDELIESYKKIISTIIDMGFPIKKHCKWILNF
ncbi:MAG: hypothetical protein ACTSWY_13300, partial [Promethearchaeota archaeon]